MQAFVRQKKYFIIGIPVIIALVLAGYVVFLKYRETQRLLENPAAVNQADITKTIAAVGKLMLLPQNETPTVATVSDISKLKDQPFFANAENGDRVLIYQESKKAILYRPTENKIIEVAPVNVGPAASGSASIQSPTPSPTAIRFVLLNGTTATGLTKTFEPTLTERVPNAEIVDRANAQKQDYHKSLLIDITGTKKAQANTLANALGLTVSSLPDGETTPAGADFLIILGQDIAGASAELSGTPKPTISQ